MHIFILCMPHVLHLHPQRLVNQLIQLEVDGRFKIKSKEFLDLCQV